MSKKLKKEWEDGGGGGEAGKECCLEKNIQEALNIYLLISSLYPKGVLEHRQLWFLIKKVFSKLSFISYILSKQSTACTARFVPFCLNYACHGLSFFKKSSVFNLYFNSAEP